MWLSASLLLLFVSSNLCVSQRAGKDREREQSIQFTRLSGNQPRTPTMPQKILLWVGSKVVGLFECTPSHSHSVESIVGGSLLLPWIRTTLLLEGTNAF